ncbi:MAG: hypothetical protein AAF633_27335, partial [Chloroflexota bacterium]
MRLFVIPFFYVTMDQLDLLRQTQEINRSFTQLVLQNGDLNDLVLAVAQKLQRSTCIEDVSYYIVADAQIGEVDRARAESLQLGRASTKLTRNLIKHGVYKRVKNQKKPIYCPPIPEIDLTKGRIIAPILIDNVLHGLLWVIADGPLEDEIENILISQAVTAAALIVLKENAAREVRNALSGDFFENLLRDPDDLSQLRRQAGRLAYRFDQPRQALVVQGVSPNPASQLSFGQAAENWLREHQKIGLCVWRGEHFILLIGSESNRDGALYAQSLYETLIHPEWELTVGVGQAYQDSNPENIRQSYREALEALEIAERQQAGSGVFSFSELGMLHWLYHLTPLQRRNNRYLIHLRALQAY